MSQPPTDVAPTYRTLPLKLVYELQPNDISRAARFGLARRFGSAYMLPAIGLFSLALGARAFLRDPMAVVAPCPIFGALMCLSPILLWVMSRRMHRRLPPAQRVIEHEITTERIRLDNGRVAAAFPWGEVRGFAHDAHAIYWWATPGAMHLIPARAFPSTAVMRDIVSYMSSRVPPAALRAGRNRLAGVVPVALFLGVPTVLFVLWYQTKITDMNHRALPKEVYVYDDGFLE